MTNKEHIAEIIKQAEKDLTKCFSILISLKRKSFNGLEDFQPMLAETLYNLTNTYNDIRAIYKESLQKQQNSENAKEWKAYKEAIKFLMKIGQNMGDIFAWYFYSNNLNLLQKHYEHDETGFFTPRLGGYGEVEFLRNFQFVGGCLLILHANTTLLRVADFSIYHPNKGIVGTIELTTEKPAGNFFDINANIVSDNIEIVNAISNDIKKISSNIVAEKKEPKIADVSRFEKQIEKQKRLVDTSKVYENITQKYYDAEVEILDKAYKNSVAINTDKFLVVLAKSSYHKTFEERLLTKQSSELPPISSLSECLSNGFIKDDSKFNMYKLGEISPFDISPNTTPIFFRDMSSDLYYDMLFCKTQLITMLNPSFILDYLSKNKCHVLVDKEKKKVEVTKEVNEKEYKINMDCLFNVISSFMLSEKAVIQLLDEILERIETEPQRIIRILM